MSGVDRVSVVALTLLLGNDGLFVQGSEARKLVGILKLF